MITLKDSASFEETIKRSRFIAHAARVTTQGESLDFYESVADPEATHNCWAWRINFQVRSNDDGEPGGTGGRPMLKHGTAVVSGTASDPRQLPVVPSCATTSPR